MVFTSQIDKIMIYIFISIVESQMCYGFSLHTNIGVYLLKNRKNSNNSITTFLFFKLVLYIAFSRWRVWCEKLSHYWQFSDWKSYSCVNSQTHSIWQLWPLFPQSKWNMGEILAFLTWKWWGLEEIFLKFFNALAIFHFNEFTS